jgi:photosystem II stability/assembly factor-like uncharacterized protein
VGQRGLVLRTTDGGDHWTKVVPALPGLDPAKFEIESVSFDVPGFGIFAGERTDSGTGVALRYDVAAGTWTDLSPVGVGCTILTDVHVKGSLAYAVGTKVAGGSPRGLIVESVGGGVFTEVSGYDIPACVVGEVPDEVEPLTEVEIVDASNVWVGGHCGRVFRFDGATWTEHKSQTDAHVRGMSFVSAEVGFLATWRGSNTQSCIVRYGGE